METYMRILKLSSLLAVLLGAIAPAAFSQGIGISGGLQPSWSRSGTAYTGPTM